VRLGRQVFRELRVEQPGSAGPDIRRARQEVIREDLSRPAERGVALPRIERRARGDVDTQRRVAGTESQAQFCDGLPVVPKKRPAFAAAEVVRDVAEAADPEKHAAEREREEERDFEPPATMLSPIL